MTFYSYPNNLWRSLLKFPCLFTLKQCAHVHIISGQNQTLVPFEWGMARKSWKFSWQSFLRSHRIDQTRRQKMFKSCIKNMLRAFPWKNHCMSNLWFEKWHLTGKFIRDQPLSFASFERLLVLSSTRNGSLCASHQISSPFKSIHFGAALRSDGSCQQTKVLRLGTPTGRNSTSDVWSSIVVHGIAGLTGGNPGPMMIPQLWFNETKKSDTSSIHTSDNPKNHGFSNS